MRYLLLAAGKVGLEIATFLRNRDADLACLVIDANEDTQLRHALLSCWKGRCRHVVDSTRTTDTSFFELVRSLEIDLGISAWWPHLLKQEVISATRLGILNFHPSLLPHNRGKHPNFWSIVEERPFGVTLHFIDHGIDSGDIAFQREIKTDWKDTGATLYEKAQKAIVELFIEQFPRIAVGDIPRRAQELEEGSLHYAKELDEASRINLEQKITGRELINLLRARTFPPHPAAWFKENGEIYEIRVHLKKRKNTRGE